MGRLVAGLIVVAVPAAIAGFAVPLHAEPTPAPFAPSASPLVLTRSLYLSLPDGQQIVVTRRYEVRFTPEESGFRVDGRLLDAEVDAPPRLSALAELERRRPDAGLFPVLLDHAGMILEPQPAQDGAPAAQQAVAGARAVIAASAAPASVRREITGSLDGLVASSRRSAWPTFLFNPGTAQRSTRRAVTLPGGTQGEVETVIRADPVLVGGLPQRVERRVTTRLDRTERTTTEVWTFSF